MWFSIRSPLITLWPIEEFDQKTRQLPAQQLIYSAQIPLGQRKGHIKHYIYSILPFCCRTVLHNHGIQSPAFKIWLLASKRGKPTQIVHKEGNNWDRDRNQPALEEELDLFCEQGGSCTAELFSLDQHHPS